jgi:hypothetical protein
MNRQTDKQANKCSFEANCFNGWIVQKQQGCVKQTNDQTIETIGFGRMIENNLFQVIEQATSCFVGWIKRKNIFSNKRTNKCSIKARCFVGWRKQVEK